MKILRVIDTLGPHTGGPAVALRALCPVLADLGHETVIVTLDAPGESAAAVPGATVVPLGPAHAGYRFAPALRPWLERHVADFDAAFVHGLWQFPGLAVRAAARARAVPYFVYPHGMLDPWFRAEYPLKHLKKWLYWQVSERRVLRDAAAVLYTCEEERRLARTSFAPYRCVERVVNYGTAAAPPGASQQVEAWYAQQPELRRRPFLLYLGRLHPKKGLDLLIEAYAARAAREPGPPALVIAGPAQDEAWCRRLRKRAAEGPAAGRVILTGLLQGDVKWGALRAAEALAMPSHQENFGVAVVEALAAGTPVLISRQVNIWREIVEDGAGLADADTMSGVAALLARWHEVPVFERMRMRERAARCHAQRFDIDRVARSFLEVVEPFVWSDPVASHS